MKLTLRDPYCFVSSDDQNLAEKAVAYLTSVYRGQTESEETIKMTAKTVKFQVPGMLGLFLIFILQADWLDRSRVEKAQNAMN